MCKALKVSLSFKQQEQEIYNFLQSKLSPSIFIKELLLKEMKKEGYEEEQQEKKVEKKTTTTQGFDF